MKYSTLITGFKPFNNHKENPSELVVKSLIVKGYRGLVLNVSYEEAEKTISEDSLLRNGYSSIVSFGLNASESEIHLERCAYNRTKENLLDMDSKGPSLETIIPGGKDIIYSSFDLEVISKKLLKAGFSNSISLDPGRYLCNYVYYRSLFLTASDALFIHLPPISSLWPLSRMTEAASYLLELLEKQA